MNFLKIFQSEKKSNNESVSQPNCEVPKENDTSSPPVGNDVGLNYSHGVNTQEGCTNVSPPFENCEGVIMGTHVDASNRQTNFENGANGLVAQPSDPGVHLPHGVSAAGETGPSASGIHPVGVHGVGIPPVGIHSVGHPPVGVHSPGVHSVGMHSPGVPPVDMPPPQFGAQSSYEQKESYDYPNGSLNAGVPYPDGELYAHMKKMKADASYPCSTYDVSASDTYGGGSHGRSHDNSSGNSSRAHSSQYVGNQGMVRSAGYVLSEEKSITNVGKQKYGVNSTGGADLFQSPTDLHVNKAAVEFSSFESKTGGAYIDPKSNYAEQVEHSNSYNSHHIVGTPYAGTSSVATQPYGFDQHVSSNSATNGTVSTPGGMNKPVDYAFPSGGSGPPGQLTDHNMSSSIVHSFQHQLNDLAFAQHKQVAGRKKGEFAGNQSYMNLYGGVAATTAVSGYSYGEDLLARHPGGVKGGPTQVGSQQGGSHQVGSQQGGSHQVGSQQGGSHQVGSHQVGSRHISIQQMNRHQQGCPPNGAEFHGKGFPPSGQPRMGKADPKRKQPGGEPRRGVSGDEGHIRGVDSVGKMVRWKKNEEEAPQQEKKEDDKGSEYYYEKTLDFLRKEFCIHHSDNVNGYLNDRDMLAKTPFFKLVNFEKKLATERKRVLNYYHEDRKQIYSSTINKDKQFSHIFFNNEKYYDAKEILAYLLPYHTFYLDDICIDSSDEDEEFCESLENDVREIDAGISQIKDSFRAYTNPSMLWSFNKIIDRTDDQHNKRKKIADG
ncbi:hypothetical protein PVNG_05905 [Plasmodium vivax North Korean]|uniref:Uncharacterized protein n=1 Tax=Plasmodium vivax North Korean TaxID=1035514 RepID=A0A0J9TV73_PLAVI|nr:hypothetical protein PVNG_05905 [Plasmodium vivax North Korean]